MAGFKLTDVEIKKAKPTGQSYYLADGRGLFLYISSAGSKLWRFRYTFDGRDKTKTIGEYPAMSLADARDAAQASRSAVREGREPSAIAAASCGATFEELAREWHALNKAGWTENHARDVLRSLEENVFPTLGGLPPRDITPAMVIAELRKIEARPAIETARRIRQRMSMVFVYAIATGRGENDPAAIVKPALAPLIKGRQPAVKTLAEAREVLQRVEAIPAHPVTKLALRFLALTVMRPGPLIETTWAELGDLDPNEPTWRVPAARMKLRTHQKRDESRDHLVPLPRQAIEVLDAVKVLSAESPYLFPNVRFFLKPMTPNALCYALNRAGYHARHVPHGWRATFSTVMNERRPHDSRIIDLMLAHVPKDKVEAAYNRAAHLARRREIADEWADALLSGLQPAAALLTGRRK